MGNITICFIASVWFFSITDCNAQLIIENKIASDNISYDQKEGLVYFGNLPVLSLSASDFVIEEYGDGMKKLFNWNNLRQDNLSARITISESSRNIIHFECDLQADSLTRLRDLFFQLKFLPRDTAAWSKCRKDFHWIPNIKSKPSQIASDHVFRSPVLL